MPLQKSMKAIQRDLHQLREYEVIVYGSVLTDKWTARSDIDIAVISKSQDREYNRKLWFTLLGTVPEQYDVNIFELLPLYIKISAIHHHEVVFGNEKDLSEYFYRFRTVWKDQKRRYEENTIKSVAEKQRLLQRRTLLDIT